MLGNNTYVEVNITMNNNTYNIGNVNTGSGNMYVAGRDININSPHDNGTDVKDLLKELKQLFESQQQIDPEEKELIMDDIEVITEQAEAEQPNKTRIKKAWDNITKFVVKMPMAIEENVEKLQPLLSKIAEGISSLPHICI